MSMAIRSTIWKTVSALKFSARKLNLNNGFRPSHFLPIILLAAAHEVALSADMKIVKLQDIGLSTHILSDPVVLRGPQKGESSLAFVTLETHRHDNYTAVDAYQLNGKHLSSFPVMRQKGLGFKVAPGAQIARFDKNNDSADEILVMDIEGRPNYIRLNGSEANIKTVSSPTQGILAWPPTVLDVPEKPGLVLLSVSAEMFGSENRLSLIDFKGQPYKGFPVELSGRPENNVPVVLAREGSVFALLANGKLMDFLYRAASDCQASRPKVSMSQYQMACEKWFIRH